MTASQFLTQLSQDILSADAAQVVLYVAAFFGFVPKEELLSAGITNIADKAQDLLAFI